MAEPFLEPFASVRRDRSAREFSMGLLGAMMPVRSFDHFNLRASRDMLEQLCVFYRDVVALSLGERPPFRRFGYWLYAGEQAVLHLTQADEDEGHSDRAPTTFSHAAFSCIGLREFERRLSDSNIDYEIDHVPETGQVQLFFEDPAGNGVELIFHSNDA